MPYVTRLADEGVERALKADPFLAAGLNIAAGQVTNDAIAGDLDLDSMPAAEAIGIAA